MGARTKIQDEGEVLRWFAEGRTYSWMIEEYQRKYHIETSISMWGNYRRRKGLDRRTAWDAELVPWAVKPEHRYRNPILMLRKVARCRAGFDPDERDEQAIDAWIATRKGTDTVVHYDPSTVDGWSYVARRAGVDQDLIREPGRANATRKSRFE